MFQEQHNGWTGGCWGLVGCFRQKWGDTLFKLIIGESVRAHAGFPQFFSVGFTSDHPYIESKPSIYEWSDVKIAEKVRVEFVEIQHELLHLPLIQILFKGRTFCARTFLIAKALLMAHNKGRRRQGQYSTSLCISGKLQVKNRNWCGEKKIITHLPKSLLKWSIKDNRHQVSNILYFTFAMLSICGKTWRNLNWGFNLCQIDETKNLNIFKKKHIIC